MSRTVAALAVSLATLVGLSGCSKKSLGILALATAYHLGAASAGAQSGSISATWIGYSNGETQLAVVGRTVYAVSTSPQQFPTAQVPGTDPVIGVGFLNNTTIAILSNGDVYHAILNGPWTFA